MKALVIDVKKLKENINIIKEIANSNEVDDNGNKVRIIAVVKGNGYGLGLVEYTKFLIQHGIDFFAVSTVEEAIKLREAGIKEDLLMLSSTSIESDIKKLVEKDVIISIGSTESAKAAENVAKNLNKQVRAHIKIDTGFGRYGFSYRNKKEMIYELKKIEKIKIEGTYTHFSMSFAKDEDYTNKQFERFFNCVETLKMNDIETGLLHVCNSSAFLRFSNMHLNAVRIGSAFLGRLIIANVYGLNKIGYLESNVAEIKEIAKGEYIGYSNAYKTKNSTRVAIIPCGYMDGINVRADKDLSRFIDKLRYVKQALTVKKLYVRINGKRCEILGKIGMYHVIAKIDKQDVKINDEVIFDINPLYVDSGIERKYI